MGFAFSSVILVAVSAKIRVLMGLSSSYFQAPIIGLLLGLATGLGITSKGSDRVPRRCFER
jgi:hypothetical protein